MTLYVVATPIGNLGDISDRARHVLGSVTVIACEDTRRTRTLLSHLGLRTPLVSCHEHNEATRSVELVERLCAGEAIALVSDAGTPLINDPGYRLVNAARAAGIEIVPIPGASAVLAALSVAGLPTTRFWYEGFLPVGGRRLPRLEFLRNLDVTAVLLESPHRLRQCVADLARICGGGRRLCIARELTKRYEQTVVAPLAEQQQLLASGHIPERGEVVLVLEGASAEPSAAESAGSALSEVSADELLALLLAELPATAAARVTARVTGQNRRALYARAQHLRDDRIADDGPADAG